MSRWICTRNGNRGVYLVPGQLQHIVCLANNSFVLTEFDLDEQKIPKDSSFSLTQTCSLRFLFLFLKISAYLKIIIICAELAKVLWY